MDLREFIISDGERGVGKLSLRRDGLYTVLEARAEAREELTRLYISGGGRSACLGVMVPEDGFLCLRRRLSRLELKSLPCPIENACICPPERMPAPKPEGRTTPEPEKEPAHEPEEEPAPEPEEEPAPEPEPAERLWQRRADGSLIYQGAEGRFIALPAKLRENRFGLRLTEIGGQEYLVFRY